ncbi:predicted protein [Uncinocarpus reesii 1704]|uniref:Uncharacterized protein n=1 Tax=Uncinocarpus reesii (strain UAMH 1704) TaxID=336963 RepID=C4JYX9_UNCRE|nr:uncharacterized protein UREG_07380 [Uncinocarpus reesii 1704]EEP82515.1 predicted protein [Uncinocarpus reesii 1704]
MAKHRRRSTCTYGRKLPGCPSAWLREDQHRGIELAKSGRFASDCDGFDINEPPHSHAKP